MLAHARARSTGNDRLEFITADASSYPFDTRYDLAFSRFGVMFFADPYRAFTHIRSALDDQGRLTFICWQSPRDNPWLSVPGGAAQPFLPQPETAPDPRAPGPFAFADPDYVQDILSRAGFANVAIEPCTADMRLGGDVEEAVAFLLRNGPMSRVLAELEEAARNKALDADRETMTPYATGAGIVLSGACWIASAEHG
jgi:SAM-dependent methyltransferase